MENWSKTSIIMPEKKSVWDILDSVLPTVVNVYGKIRVQGTGVDPFQKTNSKDTQNQMGLSFTEKPTKSNTIWYVLGGLVLAGGVFFVIKKQKK
jgi:LPXTG-motif cell wall-anchored protein